jgi:hypothetical protein
MKNLGWKALYAATLAGIVISGVKFQKKHALDPLLIKQVGKTFEVTDKRMLKTDQFTAQPTVEDTVLHDEDDNYTANFIDFKNDSEAVITHYMRMGTLNGDHKEIVRYKLEK